MTLTGPAYTVCSWGMLMNAVSKPVLMEAHVYEHGQSVVTVVGPKEVLGLLPQP